MISAFSYFTHEIETQFISLSWAIQCKKKHLLCHLDFISALSHRFDNEVSIRQSVEADIAGLKKVTDDTNLSRMNIESEIEAVREELAYLKKNHESVSSQHLQIITLY